MGNCWSCFASLSGENEARPQYQAGRRYPYQEGTYPGNPNDGIPRWSIPVQKLPGLLSRIEVEMEKCPGLRYPPDHKDKDTAGQPLVWTGFSEPVSQFFKLKKIDPRKEYTEFFENMDQTMSTSYTWAKTSLQEMAGVGNINYL
jgi:hypothetical protein